MKIGEVAEKLGITVSTIRYYEKKGLIPRQQRISGLPHFDRTAFQRLRFAKLTQATGFTIAQTRGLLDQYSQQPEPASMWQPFVREKRADIREQIRALEQMDRILSELLRCRCATLDDCVSNFPGEWTRQEKTALRRPAPSLRP